MVKLGASRSGTFERFCKVTGGNFILGSGFLRGLQCSFLVFGDHNLAPFGALLIYGFIPRFDDEYGVFWQTLQIRSTLFFRSGFWVLIRCFSLNLQRQVNNSRTGAETGYRWSRDLASNMTGGR